MDENANKTDSVEKYDLMKVIDKRIAELEQSGKLLLDNFDREINSTNKSLKFDYSECTNITNNAMTNVPKIIAQLNGE